MELGIYRHWKGDHYLVLFLARDSSNNAANHEDVVIYVSLDPPRAGNINARRKTEFLEEVETRSGRGSPT